MRIFFSIILLFILPDCFSQKQAVSREEIDSLPYIIVDTMPQFPGGYDSLNRFIAKNLIFSGFCSEITGTVFLEFIVEKDGSISNINVRKGITSGTNGEAVRVVSLLPKFKPGIKNGVPVRTKYHIPIRFRIGS